jgi:hypothetical protein
MYVLGCAALGGSCSVLWLVPALLHGRVAVRRMVPYEGSCMWQHASGLCRAMLLWGQGTWLAPGHA